MNSICVLQKEGVFENSGFYLPHIFSFSPCKRNFLDLESSKTFLFWALIHSSPYKTSEKAFSTDTHVQLLHSQAHISHLYTFTAVDTLHETFDVSSSINTTKLPYFHHHGTLGHSKRFCVQFLIWSPVNPTASHVPLWSREGIGLWSSLGRL